MTAALPRFSVMNAAGVRDELLPDLEDIAKSASDAIVIKSMTVEPREGNPEPRLYVGRSERGHLYSLNSMGLPNLGYREYEKTVIPELRKYQKPIIASISTAQDPCTGEECSEKELHSVVGQYQVMVEAMERAEVDVIQMNLSCPNLVGKDMICYSPETVDEILKAAKPRIPWSVKVGPYNGFPRLFGQVAKLILKHEPAAIVAINSEPDCLDIDEETGRPVITARARGGFGGMGGDYLRPIALGEVRRWYLEAEKSGKKTEIVGCGGITGWRPAIRHIWAGASHLEVGTWLQDEGTGVFEELKEGIQQFLFKHGYKDLEEIRGKMRGDVQQAVAALRSKQS